MWQAKAGGMNEVKRLPNDRAEVDKKKTTQLALHVASKGGNMDEVKRLL